jgi:hypothetical protein
MKVAIVSPGVEMKPPGEEWLEVSGPYELVAGKPVVRTSTERAVIKLEESAVFRVDYVARWRSPM